MKKKILLITSLTMVLVCLFAISVFAENNIIKLETLPTLEEIHANPSAYVSHLDAFDDEKYDELDKESVVVLSDLAETPTYYVYPAYYYMPGTSLAVYSHMKTFNSIIAEADSTAFAGYSAIDSNWAQGGCKYLIRIEVPTHVTTIAAKAKFEGSSNLLEVYFPTKTVIDEETGEEKVVTCVTSVSGENLFGSCKKLEVIHNMGLLPKGIIQGNNAGFTDCNKLEKIEIPDGTTTIPNYMFKNCYAVTEIVLPNSVTTIGKQAFAYCTSLETISFGANCSNFIRVNNDYETFSGTNNLKYVYMPSTFADNITAKSGDYKNVFSGMTAKVTFFVTADYDKASEIKEKFAATNANQVIGNATLVEYSPDINYFDNEEGLNYAETLGYNIIVYNYSACEAFYNGVHDVDEEFSLVYSGEELLSSAIKSKACANCTFMVDRKDLAPLFKSLGYSTSGNGDIVQGFCMDTAVLDEYVSVLGEINYGVVAAIDTREDTKEGVDLFTLENKLDWDLSSSPNNYFDIKITGITDQLADQHLFFCAYVKFGGVYYYINNGEVGTTAMSTTYNLAK